MGDDTTLGITLQGKDEVTAAAKTASQSIDGLSSSSQNATKQGGLLSDGFEDGMKKVSLATAAAGAGLTLYAKSSTDTLEKLVTDSKALATQTGMTAVQSSELIAAFQHMNIDTGTLSVAFRTFAKDISTARDATADNALQQQDLQNKIAGTKISISQTTAEISKNGDASGELNNKLGALNIQLQTYQKQLNDTTGPLDKLGVSTQNADGSNKSFNDILMEVADKFHDMPDGAEKSADAIALFGRSGTSMIKVLDLGSQGIQDLEDKAKSLGITLTSDNIVAVNKYIQSQNQLKEVNEGLKISVGTLTTPIMTTLNTKMAQLAQSALATGSPIRGVTADVLAFGGPVLAATAALTGFLGNLASIGPLLNSFKLAATGMVAILSSPWVIAFAAAALGLGVLADHIFGANTQTQALTTAENNLRTATDNLHTAQDGLAQAHLNEEGAALAVESAQNNYNQAVAAYGPQSLQARQASYDLQVAQNSLAQAHQATTSALQQLKDKQDEVAKDQSLINHLEDIKNATDDVTRGADGAVTAIGNLNSQQLSPTAQKIVNTGTNSVGAKIDLSPLVKKAGGGPVSAGHPYIVGDNPDGSLNKTSELFIPNTSGTIIPANKTQQMMTPQAGNSGSGQGNIPPVVVQLNVSGHVISNDATMRPLAITMAQLVQQALKGQGVDNVSQLRVST